MKEKEDKTLRRHRRWYNFFVRTIGKAVARRTNYRCLDFDVPSSPCLVLANHNTDLDPILVGYSFPREHMYFVASEHIFRLGFITKLLVRYLSPIAKKKGYTDASTVLNIKRRLKKGSSVCFFPEGDKSYSGITGAIKPATGALVRSCNVDIVCLRITGGYFTSPRWAYTFRKGEMKGEVTAVLKAEQLRALSPDEINKLIENALYTDAVEELKNKPVEYCGKDLTYGLETAMFICPVCSQVGTLKSTKGKDSAISCVCGFCAKLDKNGHLCGDNLPFDTISEWDIFQLDRVNSDSTLKFYDENISLVQLGDGTEKKLCCGVLNGDSKRMTFCGERVFLHECISEMAVYGRNKLVFSYHGEYFRVDGGKAFNARKYVLLHNAAVCSE